MMSPKLTTYTLYRGVPYSGLDLDDLRGGGGYGWQMLGSGLYTTDCPEGASSYAQGTDACVYELELTVPEDDIFRVDAEQVYLCEIGQAIPHIFGVSCGAFEIHIKNRETQKIVRYLVSTDTEDDLRGEALEDVEADWYVVEEFFDNYDTSADPAELVEMEEHFKHELTEDIFDTLVEFKIRQGKTFDDFEASIREHFFKEKGLSGEWDFIIDSTELASEVSHAGYKVLWVEDNLLPYSEIVILDSDLYDNGLVIIDDCTDDVSQNPAPLAKDVLIQLADTNASAMHAVVLDRGVEFESQQLTPKEKKFLEGIIHITSCEFAQKQCFHNSQMVILSTDSLPNTGFEIKYFEGFVLSDRLLMPIHHGWLTLNGKLIDLTLTQDEYNSGIPGFENRIVGVIPQDLEYLGLDIESGDVVSIIRESSETHTILDDWRPKYKRVKHKYIPPRYLKQRRKNPINAETLKVLQSFHFEIEPKRIFQKFEGVYIRVYQQHSKGFGGTGKPVGDALGWFQIAKMDLDDLGSICEGHTKNLSAEGYGTSTTPTLTMMYALLARGMRQKGYGALLYLKATLMCMEYFGLRKAYITSNSCVMDEIDSTSDLAVNVWLSLSKLLPSKISLLDIYVIDGISTPNIGVSAYVTSRQIQTKLGLDVE